MTKPVDDETLKGFFRLTRPGGPGWKKIQAILISEGDQPTGHQLPLEILCMFIGTITVYGALFATGFWLYGQVLSGVLFSILAAIGAILLLKIFGKLKVS
jgi:hypothetical protein